MHRIDLLFGLIFGLIVNNLNTCAEPDSCGIDGLGCLDNDVAQQYTEEKISIMNKFPHVLIGIFIPYATPFIEDFILDIEDLHYPKDRISLFIYNSVDYHSHDIKNFVILEGNSYRDIIIFPSDKPEWEARNAALEEAKKLNADYYFCVDSDARITNSKTLIRLIEENKDVIAPLLVRPRSTWANFWGGLDPNGFYARSDNYMQIVENEERDVWDVPFMRQAYLIKTTLLKTISSGTDNVSMATYYDPELDPDMAFCKSLRDNKISMFVMNHEDYGHLVNSENFNIARTNPEFYEIITNSLEWENRYLHENYSNVLEPEYQLEQPCPDVFWFPVVSDLFCQQLIEIMENFGQWSAGKNEDPRVSGGYENVPTRDIHMKQVGFHSQWLHFLESYIMPVQEKVFIGYASNSPQSIMNFVVRYNPAEQPFLRPHHDASTYTINIALNSKNVDYEGGGCRFIRYNCSVTDLRKGWSLIHPGRLTHYHEGLYVTKGTRYIMISFVDP